MLKDLKIRIKGTRPLLMHNSRLADPFDPIARKMKEISQRRKKTDEELETLALLEWRGGIYEKDGKVIIPSRAIEAALRNAARKRRKGKDAERAVHAEDAALEYEGPENIDELWDAGQFCHSAIVRVGPSRLTRTRPVFDEWGAEISLRYDSSVFNEGDVCALAKTAGEEIGLLEWRPKYGLFSVE